LECIYQDNTKNIWIGSYGSGINFFNQQKKQFHHEKHKKNNPFTLSHDIVTSFAEDHKGNIWITTWGGGLNYFDRKKNKHYHITLPSENWFSKEVIRNVSIDRNNHLWIATDRNGIVYLDPVSLDYVHYYREADQESYSMPGNNLYCSFIDSENNLWVGSGGLGLLFYNQQLNVFQRKYKDSILPQGYVRIIREDDKNKLWYGTHGFGLFSLDKKDLRIHNYSSNSDDPYSISNDIIYALTFTKGGHILAGTMGVGLNILNTNTYKFYQITTSHGLPHNYINGILEDRQGRIWVSTNEGLCTISPPDYLFSDTLTFEYLSKQNLSSNIQVYDKNDGLQSNEFKYGSYLKTSNGEMFFGGINGYTYFHPDSIKLNPTPPPVVITKLFINQKQILPKEKNSPLDEQISETSFITLKHYQNNLAFEFVALNYNTPQKNRYAYFLENFDKEWNYIGTERKATYTNIPPGQYVFRVRGANNDGIWNEKGASVILTIKPPIWQTNWAYSAYIFILAGILILFRMFILGQERIKNEIKMERLHSEKLEELYQLKLRFFTNISHELRTPLTLIIGPTEKMLSTENLEEWIKQQSMLIHRNAKRLLRLTNQLLDFRKLETGNLQLELQWGDIIPFIGQVGQAFENHAEHKNITFVQDYRINSLKCWFDADKLEKVLYNLLSNAMKFTPKGGMVELQVYIEKLFTKTGNSQVESPNTDNNVSDYIRFDIKDNGVGISEEMLQKIFDRFFQVSSSEEIKNTGTGIGLALTKQLIELHKGEISVQSQKGTGSCFSFRIPVIREHQISETTKDTEKSELPEKADNKTIETLPVESSVNANPENKISNDNARILLVEDNPDVIEFLTSELQDTYNIFHATDGKEGIEKAMSIYPDIIISDIMMPVIDGIKLCSLIKTNTLISHIPVILLTAKTSEDYKLQGLETGADDYITKPFNIRILKARIDNLINSRKKLQEKFNNQLSVKTQDITVTSADEEFLNKAIKVVEERINDYDLNVDTLTKEIGISRTNLHIKLKALTNLSATEFIKSIRLKQSVQLLKTNKLNISEVAYRCGFNDPKYFSKCFKKQFGKIPSEYLKSISS